ncbi:MAG: hypothetical protein AMQ22_01970 [Candidatus Methanofastidiosum methylothiophilum]|uniref:Uncharacterized protein n=1 Tax=Candidatus Methanofastidiosum methylothiophilum TaxID=1705564 RepID=A0A150IR30_9EURY|nr:MAG: hypothetical protein AMQ22_01970 [Candidatus Methanofastidiosum methylthiophilus]
MTRIPKKVFDFILKYGFDPRKTCAAENTSGEPEKTAAFNGSPLFNDFVDECRNGMQSNQIATENIPLANKIDSYYSPGTKFLKDTQPAIVLEALQEFGDLTQEELSNITKIDRHIMSRIIAEDLKYKLEIIGKKLNKAGNRKVTVYRVKEIQ